MFEWHALDHVPVSESFFKTNHRGHVYDPYHLNSIALDRDGNLLVSMRNTWAVYKVDHQTGAVLWTLGSNQSSFKWASGASVVFQHNAIQQPDGSITMFDDGGGPPTVHHARAVRISVNQVQDGVARPPVHARAGSQHQLRGQRAGAARTAMCSSAGASSPTSPSSTRPASRSFDARFTSNTSSYRAYRMSWSGQPNNPPSVAAAPNNDGTTEVWASWNGATTVSSWRVLAGPDRRLADTAHDRAQGRVRDRDGGVHRHAGFSGPGPWRPAARCWPRRLPRRSGHTSASPAAAHSFRAVAWAGCPRSASTRARATWR